MADEERSSTVRLRRVVDFDREHVRGTGEGGAVVVVGYLDFLCPYCRRLREVFVRLREALGDRLVYVFRHFPSERAASGRRARRAAPRRPPSTRAGSGRCTTCCSSTSSPIGRPELLEAARSLGLDLDRFERELDSDEVRARVEADLAEGRRERRDRDADAVHRRVPVRGRVGLLFAARGAGAPRRRPAQAVRARVREPARVGRARAAGRRGARPRVREHRARAALRPGDGRARRRRTDRASCCRCRCASGARRGCSPCSSCWSASRSGVR